MPLHRFEIERYNGAALVSIFEFKWNGDGSITQKKVSEYETTSKGAKASARRNIKLLKGID